MNRNGCRLPEQSELVGIPIARAAKIMNSKIIGIRRKSVDSLLPEGDVIVEAVIAFLL